MAGRILRVVPRVTVDMSKVANGASTVILARRIDISGYREVTLYVRFHQGTLMSSPSAATVQAYGDGYTDEDPGATTSAGLPAFLTAIGSGLDIKSATANTMAIYTVSPVASTGVGVGGLLAIGVTCTQVASVSALAVISIDLSGKE